MIMIILWTTSGIIQWLLQKKLVNVKYTCANSLAPNTLGPRDATSFILQPRNIRNPHNKKKEDTIILHSHYTNNNRDLRDELYEVSSHAVGQDELQVIQLLHRCEVGAAHPDDDNGQRLLGCLHQSRLGRFHVVDFPVRDDQQHVVLLLRLAMFDCMYVCMGFSTYFLVSMQFC